jgi:hypothetical protein
MLTHALSLPLYLALSLDRDRRACGYNRLGFLGSPGVFDAARFVLRASDIATRTFGDDPAPCL